jgi:hypothetical protein
MLRKLVATVLVVAATLCAVPTVLAALRSESASAAPFTHGEVITRGWSSRQSVDAQRLRVGVPVFQTLTVGNAGSLPASYRLTARIDGDRPFASQLLLVATRGSDGATVFSGPVTALRNVSLGRFGERTHEAFRLSITLTPGNGDDNALQGRSASVDFGWIATEA